MPEPITLPATELTPKEQAFTKAAPLTVAPPQKTMLSQTQATGFAKDQKQAAYMAARDLKDPEKAPTPMLRVVSAGAKVQRIKDSEEFKSLRPENQLKVLGHYYDKYTAPALKNAGVEPPTREDWIKGHVRQPENAPKPTEDRLYTGMSEMARGYADTVRVAGNLVKYSIGDGVLPGEKLGTRNSALSKFIDRNDKKIFDYADSVSKVADDYDSTFERRHDPLTWLSNFTGRAVGEAPAWLAAGEVGKGIKIAEAIPALTERAALSKGMAVAVQSLKLSGETIGVMKAQGKSDVDTVKGVATGLAFLGFGRLLGAALKFGSAKLAVGGEAMANKVAEAATAADHAEGIDTPIQDFKVKALIGSGDETFKSTIQAERQLREQFAREFHPEKAETAGDKSVWRNLSKVQRGKILDHIEVTNKQAAELMPLINPEVQTIANTKTILDAVKDNPQQAARLTAIQKLTGLDPGEVLTKMQAKEIGQQTGLMSPARELEQSFGEGSMYGESRVKGAKTVSNASLLNPKLPTEDFINGTRKYLEPNSGSKSVKGREHFENPEHHLLWVANYSDAPAPIKNRAFTILRQEFNLSREQAGDTAKGGWLANFRADLARTGHLDTEGNIFRSTKNTQRRYATPYQKQVLEEESILTDRKAVAGILRKHPEMRASFDAMNETLTDLKNKSATPITEKLRRTTQDRMIDLLQRYK